MLANRPESQDSNFMWADLAEKNNNELLKNIGNFSARILKFIEGHYAKVIPEFVADDPTSVTNAEICLKEIYAEFINYVTAMEAVKIKEALKIAMGISNLCNKYMQDWKPWETSKTNPKFAASAVNVLVNVFILLCAIMEPFIPTFSAKVYAMMNWKRGEREETLLGYICDSKDYKKILTILPPKHTIGEIFPIFRESTVYILISINSH